MSLIVMCGCPNQKRTFGCGGGGGGGGGGEGGVGGQTNKVEGGCVEACACGGFAPKLGKVRASTSLNFQNPIHSRFQFTSEDFSSSQRVFLAHFWKRRSRGFMFWMRLCMWYFVPVSTLTSHSRVGKKPCYTSSGLWKIVSRKTFSCWQ